MLISVAFAVLLLPLLLIGAVYGIENITGKGFSCVWQWDRVHSENNKDKRMSYLLHCFLRTFLASNLDWWTAHYVLCQHSSVGMMTSLQGGWNGVRFPAGTKDIFLLHRRPDRFWGLISLLLSGYREFFARKGLKAGEWSSDRSSRYNECGYIAGLRPQSPCRFAWQPSARISHNLGTSYLIQESEAVM